MSNTKFVARTRRKKRIRGRIVGTSERPRLSVFRSLKHVYAQVIDDSSRTTLAQASTMKLAENQNAADLSGSGVQGLSKCDQAKKIGESLARSCITLGIEQVVFDRGGYRYHGRVAALATGARTGGLKF